MASAAPKTLSQHSKIKFYIQSAEASQFGTMSASNGVSVIAGFGWNINNLTFVHDGDGFGDIVLATRARVICTCARKRAP